MTLDDLRGLLQHVTPQQALYSQAEEDAVLDTLVHVYAPEGGTFVEIGVGSGAENNTRRLAGDSRQCWHGTWYERGRPLLRPYHVDIIEVEVTPENVVTLLQAYAPPPAVDVFSLDIDGNDFWVGGPALGYLQPKIAILEYNAGWHGVAAVMPYAAGYQWRPGQAFGCSLDTWVYMLEADYDLVYTTRAQVNAFFLRKW